MVLAGDGRCDSPGKSAKYCTYSFIDTNTDKIIHTKTIDKREVSLKSPNMEIKAFEQGIDFLTGRGLDVVEVVTDGSTSIKKSIRMLL